MGAEGAEGGSEEKGLRDSIGAPVIQRTASSGIAGFELRSDRRSLPVFHVVKAGYLQKKGGGKRRANWSKRWFVLERNKISYYTNSDKKTLKGSLRIDESCCVVVGAPGIETRRSSDRQENLLFSLVTPSRTLLLTAFSTEDARDWMRALDMVAKLIHPPPSAEAANFDPPVLSAADGAAGVVEKSSTHVQEGFLEKLGGTGHMIWQKRWFILTKDKTLLWYASSRSREHRNSAMLAPTGLRLDESTMRITVPLIQRNPVTLRAADEVSFIHWSNAFSAFIETNDQGQSGEAVAQAAASLEEFPTLKSCVTTGIDPSRLFTNRRPIGKGAFGEVFKARYLKNGELVAVKLIKYAHKYGHLIAGEIEALDRCDHPSILGMLGCFLWKEYFWLTTPYCDSRTLRDLCRMGPLPEGVIAGLGLQILKGLAYLSMLELVHRDIKGDNILLHSDGTAKIADLGLVCDLRLQAHPRGQSGSAGFMAPEVLARRCFDCRADVFSFGVLLFSLADPFYESDQFGALSIKNLFLPLNTAKLECAALREIVDQLTLIQSTERPTATDALLHPFWTLADDLDKLNAFIRRRIMEEHLNPAI
jgi:hypothetical protein